MLLVLDYDETYTEDPVFWDMFVQNAKQRLHTVVCCTMRVGGEGNEYYNQDVLTDMEALGVEVVFAAEKRDKWEAMQHAGYNPENAVWVDDRPMYVYMDDINKID